MRWSDIPFRPTPRTLRQFAGLWIVFFLALAAWQWFHHQRPEWAAVLGIVAITVGPAGLLRPSLIRPIYVGWMVLAFPVGWVLSHLLLAVVFYGVVTPVGLILRLAGHDALARRRLPERDSYWEPRPEPPAGGTYYRQF
jgi:TRAP-type C4-dicarboxylate transport system permease small subunit